MLDSEQSNTREIADHQLTLPIFARVKPLEDMPKLNLETLISELGWTLLSGEGSFEDDAKKKASHLTDSNIDYLISKLHNPPMIDSRIDSQQTRLGQ